MSITTKKAYQQLSPFHQLPLLIIDDKHRISHDLPICRYLVELGHLRGANAFEASTCDMIVEQLRECIVNNIGNNTDVCKIGLLNNQKREVILCHFQKDITINHLDELPNQSVGLGVNLEFRVRDF